MSKHKVALSRVSGEAVLTAEGTSDGYSEGLVRARPFMNTDMKL